MISASLTRKATSKFLRNIGLSLILAGLLISPPAHAQTAKDQASLAALSASALRRMPAKNIFGAAKTPTNGPSRAIGSYALGCLSGAQALPQNSPSWQVMRPSRNRNWAHPALIKLLEQLAQDVRNKDGWNGLLVGDLSQPRGGPMLNGHASHQIGLDADIWLNPMPDRVMSRDEREKIQARPVVKDRLHIDPAVWTEMHAKLIKRAASYPQVARIFVHPPIKAELCKWATGDRSWLAKIRPYYNHTYHMHVRMNCPPGYEGCKNQAPVNPKDGTGCGTELAYWMSEGPWKRLRPPPVKKPVKPAPPLAMSALPGACVGVGLYANSAGSTAPAENSSAPDPSEPAYQ